MGSDPEEFINSLIMEKPLPPVKPDSKERKETEGMANQLLKQCLKATRSHHYYEAYMLGWTSIEQFLLPDLLGFVSKKLKIDLPKDLPELPISHVIRLYYFISHDLELFRELERSRKIRNKLVHNLYKQQEWNHVKLSIKTDLKEMAILFGLFQDRFSGKTPIPALQIYRKGWNEALEQLKKNLLEGLRS